MAGVRARRSPATSARSVGRSPSSPRSDIPHDSEQPAPVPTLPMGRHVEPSEGAGEMAQVLYTAEVVPSGNGRYGEVVSSDGVIDEKLATPKELGGPGGPHTNPEQLFAAGYAAC